MKKNVSLRQVRKAAALRKIRWGRLMVLTSCLIVLALPILFKVPVFGHAFASGCFATHPLTSQWTFAVPGVVFFLGLRVYGLGVSSQKRLAVQEAEWDSQARQEEQRQAERTARAHEEAHRKAREDAAKQRHEEHQRKASAKSSARSEERYHGAILGLKGRVTPVDVRRAYKELAALNHPDKVNHMAPKIRELATEEMKKINEAYQFFRKQYDL
jgi:hypothetical protein